MNENFESENVNYFSILPNELLEFILFDLPTPQDIFHFGCCDKSNKNFIYNRKDEIIKKYTTRVEYSIDDPLSQGTKYYYTLYGNKLHGKCKLQCKWQND